jgi:hypothetical protein
MVEECAWSPSAVGVTDNHAHDIVEFKVYDLGYFVVSAAKLNQNLLTAALKHVAVTR